MKNGKWKMTNFWRERGVICHWSFSIFHLSLNGNEGIGAFFHTGGPCFFYRKKPSCNPPSTGITWPVVLDNRSETSRKIASA